MIRHIILFCLKESFNEQEKNEILLHLKNLLVPISKEIEGANKIIVQQNTDPRKSCDAGLYCEFKNEDAMAKYRAHSKHIEAMTYLKTVIIRAYFCDMSD